MNKHISVLVFLLFLFPTFSTHAAAEPQPLISWRAFAYAPASFTGKILPPPNASIVASLDILDGSSFVNLAGETIFWYVDDTFIQGGRGVTTITLSGSDTGDSFVLVRAQINNYRGSGTQLVKTIQIPTVSPKAVIDSSEVALNLRLRALPYFFNVQSSGALAFHWEVNGQTPTSLDDPDILYINLAGVAAETPLAATLSIKNLARANEEAATVFNFPLPQ